MSRTNRKVMSNGHSQGSKLSLDLLKIIMQRKRGAKAEPAEACGKSGTVLK
jgi:hypothetical protein